MAFSPSIFDRIDPFSANYARKRPGLMLKIWHFLHQFSIELTYFLPIMLEKGRGKCLKYGIFSINFRQNQPPKGGGTPPIGGSILSKINGEIDPSEGKGPGLSLGKYGKKSYFCPLVVDPILDSERKIRLENDPEQPAGGGIFIFYKKRPDVDGRNALILGGILASFLAIFYRKSTEISGREKRGIFGPFWVPLGPPLKSRFGPFFEKWDKKDTKVVGFAILAFFSIENSWSQKWGFSTFAKKSQKWRFLALFGVNFYRKSTEKSKTVKKSAFLTF